ncbi:MAG TPA: hypothetical protein VGG25_24580 [Streptosporangiaceae bacterium]|jgi:hypothetical protein
MTDHVSTEDLARLAEGDLRDSAARRVRAHLDGCEQCQAVSAALARIPALLAETPAPPMPAYLSARIDSALAAESARRAADQPSATETPVARGSVSSIPAARSRHGGRRTGRSVLAFPGARVLAAAAAIVIIGGGGYELLSHFQPGPSTTASGTVSGTSHRPGTNSPASEPRLPAASGQALGPLVQYSSAGRSATIRPVRSGTGYQPSRLTAQVKQAMAQFGRSTTRAVPNASPDIRPTFGGVSLARLAGCLSRVADGRPIDLVDVASFGGKPATVIVTGSAGHGRQAVVVGPGCSATSPDVLARRAIPGS